MRSIKVQITFEIWYFELFVGFDFSIFPVQSFLLLLNHVPTVNLFKIKTFHSKQPILLTLPKFVTKQSSAPDSLARLTLIQHRVQSITGPENNQHCSKSFIILVCSSIVFHSLRNLLLLLPSAFADYFFFAEIFTLEKHRFSIVSNFLFYDAILRKKISTNNRFFS